jgi:hypothetical protein
MTANTPITKTRIDEIAAQFQQGAIDDRAHQEIWQAAQLVPQLVDMLRAYIEEFDDWYGDDADELRRDARYLIGE